MIVGIDVDGVLVDMNSFMNEMGTKLYGPIKNPNGYSIADKFDLPEGIDKEFWDTSRREYLMTQKPIPGIEELNQYLTKYGIQHYIITNRGDDADDPEEREFVRVKTKEFVDKYFPNATAILHNDIRTKLPVCLEHHIDVMIEDSVRNVEVLSEHMHCILINWPYNINYINRKVIHAKDLKEAANILGILKGMISRGYK